MPIITTLGNAGAIWLLMAVVLLIMPKHRTAGLAVLFSLVISFLIGNIVLKLFFARVRPFDIDTTIQLLIQRPRDFSFPSGHTAASFSSVSALFISKNRLWIPGLVLACLIAFSRLYLYVHYPSDVLAGAVLGIVFGFVAAQLAKMSMRKQSNR